MFPISVEGAHAGATSNVENVREGPGPASRNGHKVSPPRRISPFSFPQSATLPVRSALVHVLCITIALIEVAFCVAALADGRSVIVLKDEPPTVVDIAVLPPDHAIGKNYQTLAQLLGPRYGIGLMKDSSGRAW